jgi:hypothetical protein
MVSLSFLNNSRIEIMNTDFKVLRLERYFRDPIVGDDLLQPPMSSVACRNIRSALRLLGYKLAPSDLYDKELEEVVLAFQYDNNHTALDGLVGPGTRRLLTEMLLSKRGEKAFTRMKHPEGRQPPIVFLSYAWKDTPVVNKLDQWLRDHGIRVLRDTRNFKPGHQIPNSIRDAIIQADKVVAVYSTRSKHRDWPRFEISIAEEQEKTSTGPLLIYLILDNTQLPKYDPHRIAIKAKGRALREVGQDLLKGILGQEPEPARYDYDENERL